MCQVSTIPLFLYNFLKHVSIFDFECTLMVHGYLCNDPNEDPNQGKLKQAMTKQIKCSKYQQHHCLLQNFLKYVSFFYFECTLMVHRYLFHDQNEEPNQGKLKQAMIKQIKCAQYQQYHCFYITFLNMCLFLTLNVLSWFMDIYAMI